MRTRTKIVLALVGFGAAVTAFAADMKGMSAPWIDMEKCSACAPYMAEPGLMEHAMMDNYSIATGLACVTTVPAEYEAALERAHSKCNDVIKRAQGGEKLYLCGMCSNLLSLAQAGAKIDDLNLKSGELLTVTSTDPTLIQKIHAHVEKTQAEMTKMSQASSSKTSYQASQK